MLKKLKTKILVTSVILLTITAESSFAEKTKTEGNFVGVDLIGTSMVWKEEYSASSVPNETTKKPASFDQGFGLGIKYKRAFNFDGFFLAPGIGFEKFWNTSSTGRGTNYASDPGVSKQLYRLDLRSRTTFTNDFGYDFSDKFSAFFSLGYGLINAKSRTGIFIYDEPQSIESSTKKTSDGDTLYGVGLNYRLNKSIILSFEANTQKFRFKNNTDTRFNSNYNVNYSSHYAGRLTTIKAGMLYNF